MGLWLRNKRFRSLVLRECFSRTGRFQFPPWEECRFICQGLTWMYFFNLGFIYLWKYGYIIESLTDTLTVVSVICWYNLLPRLRCFASRGGTHLCMGRSVVINKVFSSFRSSMNCLYHLCEIVFNIKIKQIELYVTFIIPHNPFKCQKISTDQKSISRSLSSPIYQGEMRYYHPIILPHSFGTWRHTHFF